MNHIDTDDDFAFFALKYFKIIGGEEKVHQNCVRFVHVHDADAIRLEDDVGFQEDVFEGRHQDTKGCYLDGFDGEHIVVVFTIHILII